VFVFYLFKQLNLRTFNLSFVHEAGMCDFFSPHAGVHSFIVFGQHLRAGAANASKQKDVHACDEIIFYECDPHRTDTVTIV